MIFPIELVSHGSSQYLTWITHGTGRSDVMTMVDWDMAVMVVSYDVILWFVVGSLSWDGLERGRYWKVDGLK